MDKLFYISGGMLVVLFNGKPPFGGTGESGSQDLMEKIDRAAYN